MYSKQESQRLKHEFWIAFAEAYPRKWLLYDTKVKDFAFKFFADNKKAQVVLEFEMRNDALRRAYFEKAESLHTILTEDYLPDAIFFRDLTLDNGKTVSRITVELSGVSLNNRAHWPQIFDFFADKMQLFELFFYEFEDFLKAIDPLP